VCNHGLRRTYRSIATAAGIPDAVAEWLIGYKVGTQTTRAYKKDRALFAFYRTAQEHVSEDALWGPAKRAAQSL
jgi:hypothetical protein